MFFTDNSSDMLKHFFTKPVKQCGIFEYRRSHVASACSNFKIASLFYIV